VVLPTYNRSDLLGRVLQGLLDQSLPADQYEVVVVDDGATDRTPEVVAEVGAAPSRLRYFRQENKGPAAARNHGVRESRGKIILFTGDDCIPDRRLLEQHLRAHDAEGDVGVIGHIAWHPELEVTPFMSFLEQGVQFGFGTIEDTEDVQFWSFYTSNCSVQKHRVEETGGFDEDFKHAAYEDIELAYRMQQRGLRLIYRPAALTYHHHVTTLERYLQRQRLAGRAAVTFWRKHPELEKPLGIAHAALATTAIKFYEMAMEYGHALGVRDALRGDRPPEPDESELLWKDPALAAAGRAWIREVFRDDDPQQKELVILRSELKKLRNEWDRVTSRRLYRWSEKLAKTGWATLKKLGYRRKPRVE